MAAPCAFEPWLEGRLAALGLDGDVYGGYIRGVLREAECDAERLEGLAGALAAGEQDEDVLQEVCREIVERWSKAQNDGSNEKKEDEIQAIANIIEKQAQIVVKPKEVAKEETLQKAALLAQYAEVTDDEDSVQKHKPGSRYECPEAGKRAPAGRVASEEGARQTPAGEGQVG
uniref:coiled-coil domain-containing protein 43 isoform X2 n=1 Tax=Podarcis muralis TaxID=64176 RepID=UPI00109F86BD|nr:coiled-coil domain-containing protein 43 isoform X2 [Podarcis muralis]